MTDPIKTIETLRKPVTGNGTERDTIDAWNGSLEAAMEALESVPTPAEAYRAGLEAAADRMKEKAEIEAEHSPFNAACFDVAERSIRAMIEGDTDE